MLILIVFLVQSEEQGRLAFKKIKFKKSFLLHLFLPEQTERKAQQQEEERGKRKEEEWFTVFICDR